VSGALYPECPQETSLEKTANGSGPSIRVWQRFLAWDDFLRLGGSAGVYPRRILAGAAANGRRA